MSTNDEQVTSLKKAESALSILEGIHGEDLSVDEVIAMAQAYATLAVAEAQNRVADTLEQAAMGPGYGLWVKTVES